RQRGAGIGFDQNAGRQGMARQVGAVLACARDLGHGGGIAPPQQHLVALRQGDGQRRSPSAGAQYGNIHGASRVRAYSPQTSLARMKPACPSRCLTFSQPEEAGSVNSSNTPLSTVITSAASSAGIALTLAPATVATRVRRATSALDSTQAMSPAASRTLIQS